MSNSIHSQILASCSANGCIASIIDTAADSIYRKLAKDNIYLPPNFRTIIYASETPKKDLANALLEISMVSFSNTYKATLALSVMEDIHEALMRHNSKKFGDPTMHIRFVPFALLGSETALKYLKYIYPILVLLGLTPEYTDLLDEYKKRQLVFNLRISNIGLNEYVKSIFTTRGCLLSKQELDELVTQIKQCSPEIFN